MTLQTLADALGVSRTTASNAFNRPDQLNPALRERVLALAAELGYAGPDPAGRALRSGRSGAIGVLLTEQLSYAFGDPAAVSTLRGLAIEAEQVGISLALLPAPLGGGPGSAEAVTRTLVDACFVYALPEGHPSVAAVLERRIPVVVSDTPHVPASRSSRSTTAAAPARPRSTCSTSGTAGWRSPPCASAMTTTPASSTARAAATRPIA